MTKAMAPIRPNFAPSWISRRDRWYSRRDSRARSNSAPFLSPSYPPAWRQRAGGCRTARPGRREAARQARGDSCEGTRMGGRCYAPGANPGTAYTCSFRRQTAKSDEPARLWHGRLAACAAFYDAVLAPLGGRRVMDFGEAIGYGVPPKPDFWIGRQETGEGFRESHLAFSAPDRASVRAFFQAAVASGAEVLHEPRVWPEYHASYYGAFVRDPDGNNVEAVCHLPE